MSCVLFRGEEGGEWAVGGEEEEAGRGEKGIEGLIV